MRYRQVTGVTLAHFFDETLWKTKTTSHVGDCIPTSADPHFIMMMMTIPYSTAYVT